MLILVGESGSGKSTVQKELVNNFGYKTAILSTTRPKRENEADGIDYNFLSKKSFEEISDEGYFMSVKKYNDWWYGIPKPFDDPDNYVIVATPADMRYIKKTSGIKNIFTVYITVPRRDRMIMALLREDDIEEVYRRSLTDIGQFDGIKEECDFVVSNQINNNEFNHILTIQDLAKNIDELYKRRFTI